MTYRSPVADILFSLDHVAGFDEAIGEGLFGELDAATAASVIEEAGRFATDVIAPLNRIGDLKGAVYENGHVSSPPGFRDAYRAWAAGGWAGVTGSPEYGGMGLPHTINAACARTVERRLDGLRAMSAAQRRRDRRSERLRPARSCATSISAS